MRGAVHFPRMEAGASDVADQIFTYVASAEIVARYRFARASGWYSGVGGALQFLLSRASVGRGWFDANAVGGSAVAIVEFGAAFGDHYQSDWGLRVHAGMPVERWGLIVDIGMYAGHRW